MATETTLLWILLLTGLQLSVSHDLNLGEDYEVVRPVRLHTVNKRHAEYHRPQVIKYGMTVGGQDMEMHLERNDELVTKDYTETHYLEDGTRVTTAPDNIDHCYYQGRILNDSSSAASISTCDGLRGYFRTSAQRYLIEPLTSDPDGDHAVVKFTEEDRSTPAVCGVTNTSWSDDYEPPTGRSRFRSGLSMVQQQKYLELYLVADYREYQKMKKDLTELRKRMFEVVNFVNMAYKPMRTFVALVGLEVWSSGDLISITPPAGANLDAFMKWRNTELIKIKPHDNAHLISAIDFEGATVGLAFIGTLCSGHSVGVVQDHNDKAIAIGATLAHEMGHNLGMDHDDSSICICTGDSCIMAAALSWNVPRSFSSCSGTNYEKFQLSRSPNCLLDKPDFKSLVTPAVCGNGFVETGEQCDCGTVEECSNPCCNATTCVYSEGSQCAEGECCEKCKILPRSRECRAKSDKCDIAEYCNGKSAVCPEDVFAVNGLLCNDGLGYCYNGQCPQLPKQCMKMYGPSAIEARKECFDQNTRGTYYAFCKRPAQDQFIPCQKQDIYCGKLFCHNGNDSPNYGRMVRVGDCKATFYDDFTKDNGQVETGTKCGDGKVCSQNECVDLQTAYRNTNCSAKCPGHAVCNHRSQCQCEPGWTPPNCDTEDGEFTAMSTGVVVGISIAVILVILGMVAGVIAFIWKKRQSPVLPTSHTQRKQYLNTKPVQPSPPQVKPRGPPPPPPPAGNRSKPNQNYTAARQALRPVPPPKV